MNLLWRCSKCKTTYRAPASESGLDCPECTMLGVEHCNMLVDDSDFYEKLIADDEE